MAARPVRLVIFRRRRGWYWKLVSGNNRTVAIGGEPYSRPDGAKRAVSDLYDALYSRAWTVEVRRG